MLNSVCFPRFNYHPWSIVLTSPGATLSRRRLRLLCFALEIFFALLLPDGSNYPNDNAHVFT